MDPWQSAAGHDQQWAGGIDKYNEQLQLMIDVKEKLKLAHQRRNDDLQAAKRAFEEQLDRLLTQEWAGAAPAYAPQVGSASNVFGPTGGDPCVWMERRCFGETHWTKHIFWSSP